VGARIIRLQDRLFSAQEALRFQATHDALTGIWNRGALLERIAGELERSRRKSTPLCLFLVDIDHFKRINDEFGHLVGDSVLSEIAQRLSGAVRSYDVVGRYGGEEFIVAASELNPEHPYEFAERLRLAIASSPIVRTGSEIPVSVCVGVATGEPNSDWSLEKLIQKADAALYAAKRNGRNRVELDTLESSTQAAS
jgi:diguanylate cyclase (GGDEF)-like protein